MRNRSRLRLMNRILAFFILILSHVSVSAHEVRPAYLGIKQNTDSTYQVLWKIPALGDMVPKVKPVLSKDWVKGSVDSRKISGAVKHEWDFIAPNGVKGTQIRIDGLSKTIMDVLINIELLNGEQYSQIIKPDRPFYTIPIEPSNWEVIKTYLLLGIDHILLGIDHLLFVLALVFVTHGKWKIIKTVTSFTIAHSITLSLAALDLVRIPIPPVEAIIALSIVFLAREILLHKEGKDSLTYRQPWIVAFAFGLLHGFGFASALSETGLPQSAIPLALAFFNIGVEIGQVAFVLVILLIEFVMSKSQWQIPVWVRKSPVYLIGGMSFYWLVDRLLGFL